jgi:hypothetical protein
MMMPSKSATVLLWLLAASIACGELGPNTSLMSLLTFCEPQHRGEVRTPQNRDAPAAVRTAAVTSTNRVINRRE